MTKKICISLSDWVFDEYLSGIKYNRSKYIEEMLVKGVKLETGEYNSTSAKQVELLKQLRNKDEELQQTKLRLAKAESLISKKELDPTLEKKKKMVDAIRASGILERLGE